MQTISLVSSIGLTIITFIYVVLTFMMMRSQQDANKDNLIFMEKESEARIMPVFHCSIRNNKNSPIFIVSNFGLMPAYNVEVFILSSFAYEIISSYTKELLIKKSYDDNFGLPETYETCDVVYYPVFMQNRKVEFETAIPVLNDSYTVLIQYTNIYGDNFSNYFWLIDDTDGENEYFQLATIRPERITKHDHIKIIGQEPQLPEDCPTHVKDFVLAWKETVRLKPTKLSYLREDRGKWFAV